MKPNGMSMMAVVAKPKDGSASGDEPEGSGLPEFAPPDGFEVPEGTKPGEEFQSVATLKLDESGQLCLMSLDGADFKGSAEEDAETPEDEAAEGGDEEAQPEQTEGGGIADFQDELEQQQRKMKG